MIYYMCPDSDAPSGGVKIIYKHVDILNRNGIPACVLHKNTGFMCRWFRNSTKISYLRKTELQDTDYVVIPEFYGLLYLRPYKRHPEYNFFHKIFHSPAKKVIFNQNTFYTFRGNTFDRAELGNIHNDKDIIATIVVSEDGQQSLEYIFPNMKTYRVHNAINPELFYYHKDKKKQISYMPRKNEDHALQVANILKYRGILDDFLLVPIENMTEAETACVLRESLFFISFGYPEGFSLPPAEAMACGCIVIGYHGMGGREYFKPEFCFPVETGDIVAFAQTIENAADTYEKDPGSLIDMAKKASDYIKDNYSPERETRDVLRCWDALLQKSAYDDTSISTRRSL